MVMVELDPALPGVTEVGEKDTVDPAGRPLAARVTGCVKAPLRDARLT
jgi:hypothetical protein